MSQEQQPATGIDLLTKVVMPKLIERVKNVESEMVLLKQQMADLVTATAKPANKRKTKAEKEAAAKAAAAAAAQAALAPEPEPTVAAPDTQVQPEVAPEAPLTEAVASAVAADGNNANMTPVAGTVAATQSDATATGVTSSAAVVGNPAAPMVIEGYPINGTIIQAVQYVMQQGFSDGPSIAQALGIPQSPVDYILALPVEQQLAIYQQFPPVAPV